MTGFTPGERVRPPRGILRRLMPAGVSGRTLLAPLWSSVGIQLASALSGIALARGLGAEDRGLLAAVMLWPLTVTMLLEFGASEYITVTTAADGPSRGAGFIASARRLSVVTAPIAGIASILILSSQGRLNSAPIAIVAGFALVYPLLNLRTLAYAGGLNGAGHHSFFQTIRLLVPLLNAVAMGALLGAGQLSVGAALVAVALSNWLALGIAWNGWRRLGTKPVASTPVGALLRGGVGFQASSLFANLVIRVDQLVVAAMLGDAALGLYVVAVTVSSPIATLAASLAGLVLPDVARGGDRLGRYRSYQLIVVVVGTLGSIVVALSAPLVVPMLFGPDFVGSIPASRYLAFASVPLASLLVSAATVKAAGDVRGAILGQALATAVALAGLVLVLGRTGILGAAQVSLISYTVGATFLAVRAVRGLREVAGT